MHQKGTPALQHTSPLGDNTSCSITGPPGRAPVITHMGSNTTSGQHNTPETSCCCDCPSRRLLQLPGPEINELGRAAWPVSSSELNKAYRKLSLLVHPDKAPGPEARQAFEQLKQAYNELKDTDKLVRVDLRGARHAGQQLHISTGS